MKATIYYRDASDHGRQVREFLREFSRQTGKLLDEANPDSPLGIQSMETYDIVELPTIIATDSNGNLLQLWRGLPLPRISEVSYYVE